MSGAKRSEAVSKGTLRGLQALRFAAAAMVVMSHVNDTLTRGRIDQMERLSGASVVPWAAGVDIFFVISGFVMYLTCANLFGRSGASWTFLKRRIVRIVPLYWTFTLLAVLAVVLIPGGVYHKDISISHVIASALFIPWIAPSGETVPPLSVGWTLNFEMLFYVAFALGLFLPRKGGLALIATSLIVLVILSPYVPEAVQTQFSTWGQKITLEFLYGIGLALAYRRRIVLPFGVRAGLVAGGAILLVVGNLYGLNAFRDRWIYWGGPSAMIVAAFVLGSDLPDRLWSRLLEIGGNASYALYLSHPFSIRAVGIVLSTAHVRNAIVYWVVAFVASTTVSLVVHFAYERPLMSWFQVRARDRKSRERAERSNQ